MTGPQQPRIVFRFDRFSVDLVRGTLRGPDGTDLALRPKAFSLLCHLLDHPSELQGREDLFEALWPGVIVTDDSLTQCVSDLRRPSAIGRTTCCGPSRGGATCSPST